MKLSLSQALNMSLLVQHLLITMFHWDQKKTKQTNTANIDKYCQGYVTARVAIIVFIYKRLTGNYCVEVRQLWIMTVCDTVYPWHLVHIMRRAVQADSRGSSTSGQRAWGMLCVLFTNDSVEWMKQPLHNDQMQIQRWAEARSFWSHCYI